MSTRPARKPTPHAIDPAVAHCFEAATQRIEADPVTRARGQWADDVWHSFSAGDRFAFAIHMDAIYRDGKHAREAGL